MPSVTSPRIASAQIITLPSRMTAVDSNRSVTLSHTESLKVSSPLSYSRNYGNGSYNYGRGRSHLGTSDWSLKYQLRRNRWCIDE